MPRKVGKPVPAYPAFLRDGRGACATADPNLFTEVGDRGKRRNLRVAEAKRVCLGCPFRPECAAWALATNQTGVWGGMSDEDRAAARRKAAGGYPSRVAA